MKIKELAHNPKNPRKMSDQKLESLKKSLDKFGDLSGWIFNRSSGLLISGHQRSKIVPEEATIVIEKKYKTPTRCMTVATGYVEIEGERFSYREVEADPQWEVEALLAANKHSGDWDDIVLGNLFEEFPELDMELAGFSFGEIGSKDIKDTNAELNVDSFDNFQHTCPKCNFGWNDV